MPLLYHPMETACLTNITDRLIG